MDRKTRTYTKNETKNSTATVNLLQSQGMFKSRPFGQESEQVAPPKQPLDFTADLMRTQRYGHNLSRMQFAEPSATSVQPKMKMGQPLPVQRTEEPSNSLSNNLHLNLGAGQNPMLHPGSMNLEYNPKIVSDAREDRRIDQMERGLNEKERSEETEPEVIIADASRPLPFRPGVFDQVHAINPYGFNPVNEHVSAVLSERGDLKVSGAASNKFAMNLKNTRKPNSGSLNKPSEHGFLAASQTDLIPEHNFGEQAKTGGTDRIDPSDLKTNTYKKRLSS